MNDLILFNLKEAFSLKALSTPFYKFRVLTPPGVDIVGNSLKYQISDGDYLDRDQSWDEFKEQGWEEKNLSITSIMRDIFLLADYRYRTERMSQEESLLKEQRIEKFILQHGPLLNVEKIHENYLCPARNVDQYLDFAFEFCCSFFRAMLIAFEKRTDTPSEKLRLLHAQLFKNIDIDKLNFITSSRDDIALFKTTEEITWKLFSAKDKAEYRVNTYGSFEMPAWFLLLKLLSNPNKIDICDECKVIYFRKRLPKKGQYSYCPECRKTYRLSKKISEQGKYPEILPE